MSRRRGCTVIVDMRLNRRDKLRCLVRGFMYRPSGDKLVIANPSLLVLICRYRRERTGLGDLARVRRSRGRQTLARVGGIVIEESLLRETDLSHHCACAWAC